MDVPPRWEQTYNKEFFGCFPSVLIFHRLDGEENLVILRFVCFRRKAMEREKKEGYN